MLYRHRIPVLVLALVCLGVLFAIAGCNNDTTVAPTAQDKAIQKVQSRQNYIPKNDVEGKNYNARMKLADDPSTLIWCTAFATNPNVSPVTEPIVGKLTSGNKRPYPTQVTQDFSSGDSGQYNPELPGPDGMYGTSGEYRYGFTPAGVYVDFYNLETFCTSAPNVYQQQHTIIDYGGSASSSALDASIQEALRECKAKNSDPSAPCSAAQSLLKAGGK